MKNKKYVSIIFGLIWISFSIFAQPNKLNNAISNKDYDLVIELLNAADDESIPIYERTILDAAKKAVKLNSFDEASSFAEIVLVFDFENEEAQNLFTSIQDLKNQEKIVNERKQNEAMEQAKKDEEKRILEELQAAREMEQQRIIDEEKAKEEYIKSVQQIGLNNLSFSFAISPLSFNYATSPLAEKYYSSEPNIRYGFGIETGINFSHPFVEASLLVDWVISPIVIAGEDFQNIINARILLGSPSLINYFTIIGGYRHTYYSGKTTVFYNKSGAPTIGLGLMNMNLPKNIYMSISADWNTISVVEKLINFAFDADFSISWYPGIKIKTADIYIKNQTSYNALFFQQESEWNINTLFAIGVSYNEKR